MRRQRLGRLAGSLAVILLGSAARGGPYIRPHVGGSTAPAGSIASARPPVTDPATDDLRGFLARPFLLDEHPFAPVGLPIEPARPAVRPESALDPRPEAPATTLAEFKPGTGSALEVPIGPGLARAGRTSAFSADGEGSRRNPAAFAITTFRAPEPASIILLLTGVIGLTARRHLLRHRP